MSSKSNVILLEIYLQNYKHYLASTVSGSKINSSMLVTLNIEYKDVKRKSKLAYKQLRFDNARYLALLKINNFSDLVSRKLQNDRPDMYLLD